MDNLATQNQTQALAQYSRSQTDRTYADQYETLLGHLICERGRGVKSALEDLRPIVAQTRRQTISARDWCMKLGFGGVGVGVLVGAGMGIGFAVLPIIAGTISIKFWADSRAEMPRRDAEYHLLKTAPNLPEALYAMHLRGIQAVQLVGAYDQLVGAIEARLEGEGDFSEHEVAEFLKTKVDNASVIDETLSQSIIQNSGAEGTPRTESAALAQTEIQPIAPGVAASPSMQHIVSPVWNPAQDLGENPQSALIVGVPGAGKGVTVSVAVRVLKERNPNLKVFVIDPKASPKERGYWESIADDYRCFSLKNCEDPDEGAAWLLRCMDAFRRLPGPKLCIFDELMTAATELELADSKLKALPKLKKFVVGLVGQGDSEAEWLWAMTQSPQVKDLGMSGGVRANLRVIGLVSPKNMTAVEALVSTQLIPKPDGGMDELRAIMAASPVGRAVFDGKIARWLPMPKLENHSGFDRDNRNLNEEKPTGNLEDVFGAEFFEGHPLLQKNESWEASQPIEVEAVEVKQSHPLKDKFDRVESLLEGEDSITVKEIQTKLKIKTSTEAQQLAQMFCLKQKSRYRFGQKANPNGTVSYFIETLT
jgi:hypothetical protein